MVVPVKYSLTPFYERRLIRESYVKEQGGLCWFCKKPLSEAASGEKVEGLSVNKKLFPSTFFKYPVHLHHDHETDLTIGAVHNLCNAILWQYYGE